MSNANIESLLQITAPRADRVPLTRIRSSAQPFSNELSLFAPPTPVQAHVADQRYWAASAPASYSAAENRPANDDRLTSPAKNHSSTVTNADHVAVDGGESDRPSQDENAKLSNVDSETSVSHYETEAQPGSESDEGEDSKDRTDEAAIVAVPAELSLDQSIAPVGKSLEIGANLSDVVVDDDADKHGEPAADKTEKDNAANKSATLEIFPESSTDARVEADTESAELLTGPKINVAQSGAAGELETEISANTAMDEVHVAIENTGPTADEKPKRAERSNRSRALQSENTASTPAPSEGEIWQVEPVAAVAKDLSHVANPDNISQNDETKLNHVTDRAESNTRDSTPRGPQVANAPPFAPTHQTNVSQGVANRPTAETIVSISNSKSTNSSDLRNEALPASVARNQPGVGGTKKSEGDAAVDVPKVDTARFVGRVSRAFHLAQERGGTLQLRLSPPELGSLRLELTVEDGALSANLEAETPAARRLLLDHLPALRDRLAEQNIRVERFDVDIRRDGQEGQRNAFQQEQQHQPHERQQQSAQAARLNSRTNQRLPQLEQIQQPTTESSGINLII